MYQYSSSTHPQFVGAHPPYTYPMYTSQGCNVPVYSQSDSSTSLSSMYTSSPTKAQNSGHSGRHRDEVTSPAISSRRICRHFAAGKCTWGSACRFSHNMTLPMTIPSDVKTNANCINTACDIQNSIVPFTTHGGRYNQATPENLNAPNPSINVAKDSAPQNRDVEITPQSIYNPLPHLNFSSTPSRYEMTPPSIASTFSPNYSYGYNPYALSEAETSFSEDYHVPVNMAHHKSSSGSHEGGGFGQQFNIQHSRAPNSDNSEDSSNSTSIRVWQHQPYGDLTSASPCRAVTSHQINMIDPPPFRGPDGVSHTYPL